MGVYSNVSIGVVSVAAYLVFTRRRLPILLPGFVGCANQNASQRRLSTQLIFSSLLFAFLFLFVSSRQQTQQHLLAPITIKASLRIP